ncbi:hypothetical protein FVEN_g4059 [Fusarium venenatum]|uniref:Extracellular membrane protein CFEM domain-containing protein n=1 Tax=Fusarium venenatum TaxID=56646 RepID=A0A2L2U3B6_9HYPO|nr:uncharacterized protein FVRRES_09262 [Fusarium venenatum]KAG8358118.1 hypothetical protein FVEN_g4059 [Fusarium venenatum]KAH6965952.1 hypothetical protein EDB82DRAFT_317387 [Fusarium venenatum]CEI69185.1 unnamed protein product [Fusarium venenatum]
MRPSVPFALSLLGLTSLSAAADTESDYLATVTLAPTASGAAAFDLEEKRAECFQACYKTYGNFKSCNKGSVGQCWCNESVDWVEREEDCVWDICGPSAYNVYATVLRRVCETVTASTSEAVEAGLMSSDEEITLTSTSTTGQASAETNNPPKTTETSTSDSGSTTTGSVAAATTSAEPNGGRNVSSSVSILYVFAVSGLHIAIMAF